MPVLQQLSRRAKAGLATGLVGTGVVTGAILGSNLTAGASTASTAFTASSTATTSPGSSSGSGTPSQPPAYHGLPDSGTVTAVGSNSVTIDGKTYAVTSNSDIDKNGEASLSSLAVGDAVTFSTDPSASTPTIDKLHAGSESLDRPTGPPLGNPPASSSSGTTTG
jgi:hypothetical protein